MRFLRRVMAAVVAMAIVFAAQSVMAQACPGQGGGGNGGAGGGGAGGGGAGAGGGQNFASRGSGSVSFAAQLQMMQAQWSAGIPQGNGAANQGAATTRRPQKRVATKNLMNAAQRRQYEIAKREMRRRRLIARLKG